MLRILIVEDSGSMRAFVRSALESDPRSASEIDVVEASSGFEALRLLPRGAMLASDAEETRAGRAAPRDN